MFHFRFNFVTLLNIKRKDMSVKGTITTADYLDYDEFKRLVFCLEDDEKYRDCLYCILSFCLGLRISDVLKLKWEDVLERKNAVVTEKKTQKTKMIPISLKTAKHILSLYQKLKEPPVSDYIFCNENGDSYLTRQGVNAKLKRWKLRYGLNINNFSSHTFRKTFGRYVYESMGRSEEALVLLNRIFRHTSIQVTMIYIGLRDDEIGKIFDNIGI